MPRRYAMSSLVLQAQQRADMENDGSIASDEWYRLVSESYGELYTIVFEAGLQYFEYVAPLTTTGAATVAEVSDHLSTVDLVYVDPSGRRYLLRELMSQERTPASRWTAGSRAYAFSLVDDQIYLYPTPPTGQTYELRYVPQPPDLSSFASTDVVDVVTPDGLSLLIWSTVVKVKAKQEADAQLAIAEREASRDRFTKSVELRALNAPRRKIVDDGEPDADNWGVGW